MYEKAKTPMCIGVILSGVSFLITLICVLAQNFIPSVASISGHGRFIVPYSLFTSLIRLLMFVIFLMIMRTNEVASERASGIIMLVVYCVVSIFIPYVNLIINVFKARLGVEYVAASGMLESTISLITNPISVVSGVLIIVALGRYTLDV